ncbi:response regulator [Secundilactobacillus odoratitofui DSM 19909 = JCM 15043]|uniref:Response regulator n=1 Tax=Secundilactobacillus odoratitofui DSM 19909 = JCM 15043 TaxID=1423776 RepID=A0A0R1LYS5_9LACO|nr:DNA-binding domain-containing protein [Secundilactobacillus odoratitofui]KRK97490.1 response regulator [Secundilactobacillus odoratitofui DSM 19909 = JCM 15043]
MKFYIIDDDPSIPMILRQILEKSLDNDVVGIAHSSKKALTDIMVTDVDIVLIDLLMPEISGIELIKTLKQFKPALRFIMISQVRDSELRAQAYEAGIEFFIDKPINVVEVKTVTEKVIQSIQMANKLSNIQSLVGAGVAAPVQSVDQQQSKKERVLSILRFLGITSEGGSSDIIAINQIMLDQHLNFKDIDFNATYHIDEREKKILFQRIRRAIKTGLTNLATICLDDMGDEIVVEYANSLYEYKNVRNEMLYLQGQRSSGGKTSLQHFFDGLVQEM